MSIIVTVHTVIHVRADDSHVCRSACTLLYGVNCNYNFL